MHVNMKFFVIVLVGILTTNLNTNGGCCCKKQPSNDGGKTNLTSKPVPGPVNNNVTVNIVKKEGDDYNLIGNIVINKNTTVADLKFEIFKIDNSLLSKKQNLSINNNLLADDNKTLAEYKVVNGMQVVVEMNSTPEDIINIKTKTITGKIDHISVKHSETVRELKEIISKKEECTSEDFRLIHNGNHLNDDERTIADYKIANNDRVHIIYKIKPMI